MSAEAKIEQLENRVAELLETVGDLQQDNRMLKRNVNEQQSALAQFTILFEKMTQRVNGVEDVVARQRDLLWHSAETILSDKLASMQQSVAVQVHLAVEKPDNDNFEAVCVEDVEDKGPTLVFENEEAAAPLAPEQRKVIYDGLLAAARDGKYEIGATAWYSLSIVEPKEEAANV